MSRLHHFTHLRVHSHYTLLGGAASVSELVERASHDGLECLALADTNALYGVVSFDRCCRAAGIRPILGMTVTLSPPDGLPSLTGRPGQLVLLAKDPDGYRSLCRISSSIQGSPDRELRAARGLDWQVLSENHRGLICLTGGRRGWLAQFLQNGNPQAALRFAGRLAGLFGESDTALSLELHRPSDLPIAQEISGIGRRLGLMTAAVQPVYCLAAGDANRLRLLAAIDLNCPLDKVPPEALSGGGDPDVTLSWLSPAQVAERFAGLPGVLETTGEIADRCGPALPDGKAVFPGIDLPGEETPDTALASLAQAGLFERYGPQPDPAVLARLERELKVIAEHNYAPLFLVVADIVRFANRRDIPVSTRGSVANSLAAYCAGITAVDPVEHNLYFERFLNPARQDPPDIDLDFCSKRRDEVLEYARQTYGADRVALVSTMNTMQPRSAVRETAKAYGLDEGQIDALVTLIPHHWHPDPRRRDKRTVDDFLAEIDDPRLKEIVRIAYTLVGQPHHLGVHAGGLTLTPGPLTDWAPVQWATKGFLVTQFDHKDIEAIGLPKIDLLGIRALTVMAQTARLVRRHYRPDFRLADIPLNDPLTGDMLAAGKTIGVFQCESAGAQRTLRQLKARSVRDLAVANAFFKPGPSTGGMAQTFIRRYRGEELVSYLHPALEPILGATKGVLIFQEQILRVAREIAGLEWDQADHLRRGMSKFKPQEMEALRERFINGCQQPPPDGTALSRRQAETLWEQVAAFAGYGFNQGHATAYAMVSYRSAFLKTHWPAPFLCARLANWGGYHHPAIYMAEATHLGIPVRPPHVNYSRSQFTLTWDAGTQDEPLPCLWMGLGQVRDLRQSAINAMISQRESGPFTGLRDLLVRVPLQPKEISHLIRCGALDGIGSSRAELLAEAQDIGRSGSARQMSFALPLPSIQPETPAQRLAWERQLLGYPITVHPLELVREKLAGHIPLRQLAGTNGQRVATAGVRLPGRTGGKGFFVGDGDTYLTVRSAATGALPRSWAPLSLTGRFMQDEWGICWFQADSIRLLG